MVTPASQAHDGHARSLLKPKINKVKTSIDNLVVCAPGNWNCNRAAAYRISLAASEASAITRSLRGHPASARVKSGLNVAQTAFANMTQAAYKLFVAYGYQEVDQAASQQFLTGQRQLVRALNLLYT